MALFRRKKTENTLVAEKLDGRLLQSVFRRYTDENGSPKEIGLGHGGRIDTANGHVILSVAEGEVFVNRNIASVRCGELMSLKGAIFSGINELTGEEDTILVYYDSLYRQ